jgi:hypothetical protein
MAEEKPESKPAVAGKGIPVGKLVSDRPEKSAAPRPKAKSSTPLPPPIEVPVVGPAPDPAPGAASIAPAGEFDVELFAVPCAPPKPVKPRDQRSLFAIDRRDFIMMGAGVGATLTAVVVGLVAARALQSKSTEDKSGDADSKSKTGNHGSDAK